MQRLKLSALKKHHHIEDEAEHLAAIVREANAFLKSLEDLRAEIIVRDQTFKDAKASGDKEKMDLYHKLAAEISQKCLDYGRELCEKPIPYWVDGDLPRDKIEIARHSYDVVRNKLCSSLNVFDNDLLPNANALIRLAEGRL